jgi:PAS domain S-box-containing protein
VSEALRWLPDDYADALPESQLLANPSVAVPAGAATSTAHVLVADDNADMRDYLRRILNKHWSVQTVADGGQALEATKRRKPDLVLTDVMMPVLDGFRLIKALREDESTRDIPVVMLSARAGEEARVDGLRAGADDYLVKPFSARELIARIAANLETSRLRRALDAERKRLRSLFENAPAIICALKGPDHVFELANPHFHRFAGNRQVLGLPARTAYPEVEGQGFLEMLDEVYRTGRPFHANESRALLDNEGNGKLDERYVTYVYQPSRTADGDVDGVLVFGFDVTEHVEARRTLQEERRRAEGAQARAESAVRVRDEFLTVASHELRTPLTTLGLQLDGLLRAMHEQPGHPDAQRWVRKAERVREQADRLEQLIESMMDVFTLSREPAHLSCVDVDLAEVVRSAVERFRPNSGHVNGVVELSAVSVVGHWDPKRLDQIATQLFSNAVKFGGGETVRVQVDAAEKSARLTVVDRGIGIAPEDRERIFGRFERATPHDYGGFGLGLWIVKELVSAMGGNVSVDSEPGRGSTFVVELPRSS